MPDNESSKKIITKSGKEALKKLIIDGDELIEQFVSKAEGIIGILRDTGEPQILINTDKLTNPQIISLLLIGKYFSYELGLVDKPSMNRDELSVLSGIHEMSISARISDLNKENKVRSVDRGEYAVNIHAINSILNEINAKI
jgi:hypothetical protein